MINETELQKPLNTPETGAVVLSINENDFRRLLRTIEFDFPQVRIIYKTLTIGKLWVKKGEPEFKENETRF